MIPVYLPNEPHKFEALIETTILDPLWDNLKRSKLYYTRGIYYFLKDDLKTASESWLEAYRLDPDVVMQMRVRLVSNMSRMSKCRKLKNNYLMTLNFLVFRSECSEV